MPVVKLMSNPLSTEQKDSIAPALYDVLVKHIHVPHIEIFFDGYDALWAFGKKKAGYHSMACIVEGPDLPPDTMTALSNDMLRVFRDILGDPEFGMTFIYHANDDNHIVIDGELLADRKDRLARGKGN